MLTNYHGPDWGITWHYPNGISPDMDAAIDQRIRDAAGDIIGHAMAIVSTPAPPPSVPGEPPHMVSGRLKASFFCERDLTSPHTFRVGNDAPYAGRLELGAGRVAPRPFLLPSLLKFAHYFTDIYIHGF